MRLTPYIRFGVVLCVAILAGMPLFASAHAVISEVLWMGSDLSTQDEWVEITGVDSDTDLSGWKLTSVNSSGNEVTIMQFATGATLPAGTSWVIARYAASASRLLEEPYALTSTITLLNSKLLLRLRNAEGIAVDQADDGVGEPFAGANPSGGIKASMERMDLHGSGAVKATWKTSHAFTGWDEGAPMLGSPGRPYEATSSSSFSSSSSSSSIGDQPLFNCINSEHIFVSELLPDPEGTDTDNEWIELQNPTSDPWTITNWTLEMEGSTKRVIPELTLEPQSVVLVPTGAVGLSLTNAGGTVILRDAAARECDRVTYPGLPTGIAYGRGADDGQWKSQCYVTPGMQNQSPAWNPEIGIESGSTLGTGKTKVNIALSTIEGFAGTPQCSVDFGDGQKAQLCNPGWHTYGSPGAFNLALTAKNACSTTVTRTLEIQVLPQTKSSSSAKTAAASASTPMQSYMNLPKPPLIISAALPNPAGDDKGHEWVEVTNTSSQTVSSEGIVFVSGTKRSTPLLGESLGPRERRRYMVSLLGLKLGNEDAGIELRLGDQIVSILRWGKAREGVVYRYSSFGASKTATVARVIDGDTFEVVVDGDTSRTEDVRLIGVDAPETVHPTKGIQPFGMEAKNYLLALIEGKKIELQFDADERDAYGRALAYVSLFPSRESVQELMIHEGLVKVDEQYLYTKKEPYLALQDQAKEAEVGMWAKPASKKSSSSKSSAKSSGKQSFTVQSSQLVAASHPYDSKPVYENIFSSGEQGTAGALTPDEGHIDDEELYASLLADQEYMTDYASSGSSPGISLGMLLGILFANTALIVLVLGGGVLLGLRMKILRV